MNDFSYSRAGSIKDALNRSEAMPGSAFIGGGTNIIDLLKYNITTVSELIDINPLNDFHSIIPLQSGGLRLGGLVSNADTAYHPLVEKQYPLLSAAILAGASAQIRNMATNAGNLLQRTRCYYFYEPHLPCNKRNPGSGCPAMGGYNRMMAIMGTSEHCIAVFPSDMCVALAALDAVVNIQNSSSQRTIAFADFHRLPGDTPQLDNNLQPGEIITGIDLPPNNLSSNFSYLKLRERSSYAFALVSVATALEMDGSNIREARIALGGVAHKPWRITAAEDFLKGREANRENFSEAAAMILDGAKGYEHNHFKINLSKKAIVRNCMMALEPASQLPGAKPSL